MLESTAQLNITVICKRKYHLQSFSILTLWLGTDGE